VSSTRIFAVFRDTLFLCGGLAGLAYQQITGHTNGELIAAYLFLLGYPGASALTNLARAGRSEPPPTTDASRSSRSVS